MRRLLVAAGIVFASCAYVLGIRKQVTIANLRLAFANKTERERRAIARKAYSNLGRVFAEMIYLRFAPLRVINKQTAMQNPELYHAALAEGKGLIVVAGHYANWEWLALGGSLGLQTSFSIVRKNIQTSFTEKFLERMRQRGGNKLINSANTFGMLRTLKQGDCVCILADQAAPPDSVKVSFLNTTVSAYEGPARLALATGANMLFAECSIDSNKNYRIRFIPITYTNSDSVETITQKHVTILETLIETRPELWLWQHKRWKFLAQ
ncbi:MAG TPA: lysophospholipid acyltransferase family protein [Candidatus Kapabacteria bacterium]|nr:lysophospholipid acyltransferase family protein [Candidatus Kapabacteria bacterium]